MFMENVGGLFIFYKQHMDYQVSDNCTRLNQLQSCWMAHPSVKIYYRLGIAEDDWDFALWGLILYTDS